MSDDFYQSRLWLDLRYQALKKNSGMCQCCGARGEASNPLQVDHIFPRSKFPNMALLLSNLQVLCRDCNQGKSNRDLTDWRYAPSRELSILNSLPAEKRFKLQQLGWIKLNGSGPQIRSEANKEYRKLWRELEAEWLASRAAAQ